MTAAAHGVTSKSVCVSPAVSAQCMATPPMTHVGHATTGGKSMKPTASTVNAAKSMEPTASAMPTTPAAPTVKSGKTTAAAVKSTTSTAPAVKPTASTPTARPGDCRDVRHDAKRAHRNACRQNAYRSFLHGTIPSRSSKAVAVARDCYTDLAYNCWCGGACDHCDLAYNYCVRRKFLDVAVSH
jgi:hypothetical protein